MVSQPNCTHMPMAVIQLLTSTIYTEHRQHQCRQAHQLTVGPQGPWQRQHQG